MDDGRQELIRRAAVLKAESDELKAMSRALADRMTETWQGIAQAMKQLTDGQPPPAVGARKASPASTGPERAAARPVPGASPRSGTPAGHPAGKAAATRPGPWPGAAILETDEAVALAALLEELAARHRTDPLSVRALHGAALLRRRIAAAQGRGIRPRQADRRAAGDTRDDAADYRDVQAAQRDRRAEEHDRQATERDRQAGADAEKAAASEQHLRDRLWDAELRDQAAAERAAPSGRGDAGSQRQLDRENAEADWARNAEDRDAVREMLAQGRATRDAALQGRHDGGQNRLAARRDRAAAQADRQDAGRDRLAARADRDQAVIDSEEEEPPPAV
ncbi:MAG TPA: hypothetical protein VFV73_44315 [Streptosporangiaceae bacterium]|nr:hypothetical protein [Streptosporangiaceae bacterium]